MALFITRHSITVLIVTGMAYTVSCNHHKDEKSKLLVRKWSYKEFKMNNETMTGKQLGIPVMEFFADGSYKFEFSGMTEEGKWKITGNELTTASDDKKTKRLKIEELTENKLVLHSEEEGNKVYITLEPDTAK
jgi:hypothetical protein